MSGFLDVQGLTNVRVDTTHDVTERAVFLPLALMTKGNAPYDFPTSMQETTHVVTVTTEQGHAWDMGQYASHNDAYLAALNVAESWKNVPNARVFIVTRHTSLHNAVSSQVLARGAQS